MASSLNSPWIRPYVVGIAETVGGDLTKVETHSKGKKVQLVEFLTFPKPPTVIQDVWARISDGKHKILVCFTHDAVKRYNQDNFADSQGRALTSHRTAVIQIKEFRLGFRRVPKGKGAVGMSPHQCLVLDVDKVEVIGSSGEAEFESQAVNIQNDLEVKEWIEGLREGGGNGNVLKVRREDRNRPVQDVDYLEPLPASVSGSRMRHASPQSPERSRDPLLVSTETLSVTIGSMDIDLPWNKFVVADDDTQQTSPVSSIQATPPNNSQRVKTKKASNRRTSNKPRTDPLHIPSSQTSPSQHGSEVPEEPTTPSEWAPTNPGHSSRPASPAQLSSSHSSPSSHRESSPPLQITQSSIQESPRLPAPKFVFRPREHTGLTSSLTAPTPAQRQKPLTSSSPVHLSSFASPRPIRKDPSFPAEKRRVPRPPVVEHPPPDGGSGRTIVPDTDISGSASQPRTQSQDRYHRVNPPGSSSQPDAIRAQRDSVFVELDDDDKLTKARLQRRAEKGVAKVPLTPPQTATSLANVARSPLPPSSPDPSSQERGHQARGSHSQSQNAHPVKIAKRTRTEARERSTKDDHSSSSPPRKRVRYEGSPSPTSTRREAALLTDTLPIAGPSKPREPTTNRAATYKHPLKAGLNAYLSQSKPRPQENPPWKRPKIKTKPPGPGQDRKLGALFQDRIWPENNWTLDYYAELLDETIETREARAKELEEYEKVKAEMQTQIERDRGAGDESMEL